MGPDTATSTRRAARHRPPTNLAVRHAGLLGAAVAGHGGGKHVVASLRQSCDIVPPLLCSSSGGGGGGGGGSGGGSSGGGSVSGGVGAKGGCCHGAGASGRCCSQGPAAAAATAAPRPGCASYFCACAIPSGRSVGLRQPLGFVPAHLRRAWCSSSGHLRRATPQQYERRTQPHHAFAWALVPTVPFLPCQGTMWADPPPTIVPSCQFFFFSFSPSLLVDLSVSHAKCKLKTDLRRRQSRGRAGWRGRRGAGWREPPPGSR
jgi:hypothetical protein